jgi:hypothetical protein
MECYCCDGVRYNDAYRYLPRAIPELITLVKGFFVFLNIQRRTHSFYSSFINDFPRERSKFVGVAIVFHDVGK